MNPGNDNYEALRKLMALKRHEQPPAEYHSQLSDSILTRIERGEGRPGFWDRLSANFAPRPFLVYAFGLTACGALGLSAFYSVQTSNTASETARVSELNSSPEASAYATQANPAAPPIHVANWLGNTNLAADPQPQISLFNAPRTAIAVSYETGH